MCFALLCSACLLVSRDSSYYVSLSHGAMGLSLVCDFGISWSYLLTFYN